MLGFGTLFFLADLLSSRLCSRLLSKCFVPLRVAALQAGQSWAKACHSSTGMLQALRVDFSTSLYRFLCPPLCRLPVESSAWNSCFGSLLSSMRVTCPDHRSCAWFNMASMPVSSAERRISWFGTCSFQLTRRTLRRQRRWNWSSFLVCRLWQVQVSQPYRRDGSTTAQYTLSLVLIEMPRSCHTRVWRRPNAWLAREMRHKTSSSRLAAEFMQLPRYLKVSTFFSAFPSMVMLGGGRAVFGVSCLNTSVFLMLTVNPNDVAAVGNSQPALVGLPRSEPQVRSHLQRPSATLQ